MRMPRAHKDKRLDILSFTSTFPEDYLPYTSSYHREAPYLVWEDREARNRKKCDRRKWKCSDSRVPCRRCSKSSLLLACTITLGIVLLTAVIAASVYLGWLTHLRNSSIVSLTGKLRVVEGDEFTPRLADANSEEFREKAKKYETLLETVYEESALRNALVKARILEFKEGSLEVNFYLTLEEPSGQRATNLSFEAKEILRREIENEDSPVFGPELKMTLERLVVFDEEEGVKYEMVQKSPEPEMEPVDKPRWPTVNRPTILESSRPSSTSTSAPPNLETHRISEEIAIHSGPWRPLMPGSPPEMGQGSRDKIIPNLFTTSSPKTSLPLLYNDPQIRRGLRNQRNRTFVADRTSSLPKSEVKEVELESPSLVLKSPPDVGEQNKNKTSSEIRFVSGFSVVRSGHYNAPGSTTKVISSTTEAPRVDLAEDRSNVDAENEPEEKTSKEEPEIVEAPLLIRDSHSPPSKVNSSSRQPQPSVRNFRPGAGFAVKSGGQGETIEIPVEASLNLKRPAKGQGFVVAVEEAIIPETISLPASTTEKPDVSTELTVGASLFIRNSRTQLDKPARLNVPFGVRKPTTKSNYFSPSPTPTKKLTSTIVNSTSSDATPVFPELKINVPFNVRGSSKGQAYVTLPKPKNESTAVVADINATSAVVKLKKQEVNSTQEDESSPGGVPKIISQYNPYNKDPSIEEDGLSLRDKYDILSISKPFFHLRTENITKYPTLKPDFTTTITLEEMPFTGTTNGLGLETTKEYFTLAPTTEPIHSLEIASSQGHPEDLGLQSIAVSPPKKCKEEEFACVSGKTCIPKTKMCNRQRDCPDASDEMNCSCADYLKSRIFRSKICDGTIDCWDYSDENNCPWCSPEKFICPGAKLCVNQSKVCDGNPDCPGSEDEAHCVKLISDHGDAERVEYRREGHLVLRKNGQWRKLCVSNFPISSSDAGEDSWTVQELGKAVCNALSFRGLISAKSELNSLETSRSDFFKFRSTKSLPGLSIHSLEKIEECPNRNLLKVSCNSLECGLRPISLGFRRRIVGGQSSLYGSWPWQVALYKEGEFQCGAVIIKDRWIISAGHCFYHSKESHWTARMGLLRRGSEIPSPYEQIANVTLIRMHPNYVDRGFINDIVLLKLEKPVLFSDQVRPICLPQITEDTRAWQGQTCTAIGWGKLFEVGRIFPDTLQEVQLPIISTEECRKRTSFLPLYKITDNMFCAGYERGGRDACLGDSGGPLMCQRANGRWSLVGVTSNGDGCGRPGRPGVYTKVVNYLEWIYSVIEKEDTEAAGRTSVCDGHRCPLGKCLPKKKVCDKVMDCWDGSDEKRC